MTERRTAGMSLCRTSHTEQQTTCRTADMALWPQVMQNSRPPAEQRVGQNTLIMHKNA